MFQEPDYSRVVSLKLSEVLNDIGVNERMALKRRRMVYVQEAVMNITHKLSESDVLVYRYGSRSEATTTIGLKSDSDVFVCHNTHNVIQDWSEWKHGRENLLMVRDETTSPGYCLLQKLRQDAPLPLPIAYLEHLPEEDLLIRRDKVLLKNKTFQHLAPPETVLNGPAKSTQGRPGLVDTDLVEAYHCLTWPVEARGWLESQGIGRWPTEDMKEYCQTSGCCLVPVSSKSGLNEETEWRISTSQAERCLMFSLNIIQIRCYVLMKMILKTIINPSCDGILSSYMYKTVLFHCIQNTNFNMWRQDNLLACTSCCLKLLKIFVEQENCPHFIIPENNLMARKFSRNSKQKVMHILHYIIQSTGRFLLEIPTDRLGYRLQVKLYNVVHFPLIKSVDEMQKAISGHYLYGLAGLVSESHMFLCGQSEIPINKVPKMIFSSITTYRGVDVTIFEQSAMKCMTPLLCSTLGSIIASNYINMHHSLSKEALIWISFGLNSDVSSGRLKFASSLYCVGDLQRAEFILRCTQEKYEKTSVEPVCQCYSFPIDNLRKEFLNKCDKGNEEVEKHIVSFCVRFLQCENHCVPKELQYEMFRTTQQDRLERDRKDIWMDWAVVDSLPFLYFLQYKTYDALQRTTDKERALRNLVSTIETEPNLGHRETALNLLGQCNEHVNQPIGAIHCYLMSRRIRTRNNAANILLCRLLSELINKKKEREKRPDI